MAHFRRMIQAVLHLEDTPHRPALAFGIGVWIAFFPLLGSHTLLALAVGFTFGLSRAALLVGAYVTNPWTLAPFFLAGTIFGCWLLGVPLDRVNQIYVGYDQMSAESIANGLGPYLLPFLVGNLVIGTCGGLLSYLGLRTVLERRAAAKQGPPTNAVANPEGSL